MTADNQKRSDDWFRDFADELHLRHVEERHISGSREIRASALSHGA